MAAAQRQQLSVQQSWGVGRAVGAAIGGLWSRVRLVFCRAQQCVVDARVNVYVHVSARMCAVHPCVKLVMGPGR